MAQSVTAMSVGSYPAFPPLLAKPAVYFCCTFLRVASTGISPASCPVKLGLSSSTINRCRDRSDYSSKQLLNSKFEMRNEGKIFALAKIFLFDQVCINQWIRLHLAYLKINLAHKAFIKLFIKYFASNNLTVVVTHFDKINVVVNFQH